MKHQYFLKTIGLLVIIWLIYAVTAPSNHSEAEDVYDFAHKVEEGSFSDQAGVNRVLALPVFGAAYKAAQNLGYDGRAFPFMIFINRLLAVAAVLLFLRLLSMAYHRQSAVHESEVPVPDAPADQQQSLVRRSMCEGGTINQQLPAALLLAFSYGFWRYANEAETYILASVLVLGAWCLVLQQSAVSNQRSAIGFQLLAVGCSAVGILVHLLNLVPLLIVIPLYYLLTGMWKRAVLHGVVTGVLVGLGYALCFHFLDWGELGAHHHAKEAGLSLSNLLRGAVAFGQCMVSGNFLFGFESFRELLVRLFPSRMLSEEFYMAAHMPSWIPWIGVVTIGALLGIGVWVLVRVGVWGSWRRTEDGGLNVDDASCFVADELESRGAMGRGQIRLRSKAFLIACVVWLLLYAVAVLRTEAGSPELWIMAIVPFWLVVAPWLQCAWGGKKTTEDRRQRTVWVLVVALFVHNLVAGLMPVMPKETDYHAQKGRWLVENTSAPDLILTDYEPVMIFYLQYYAKGMLINSGSMELNQIDQILGTRSGKAYAVSSFFQPMASMRVRNPQMYARMASIGEALQPEFEKIEDDAFGGVWKFKVTNRLTNDE